MNSYKKSDGTRISKTAIDRRVRDAKSQKLEDQQLEHGYNFCEKCGKNASDTYLDCSHVVSVDECQKSGRAELAYDKDNIRILCRDCHKKHDKTYLEWT